MSDSCIRFSTVPRAESGMTSCCRHSVRPDSALGTGAESMHSSSISMLNLYNDDDDDDDDHDDDDDNTLFRCKIPHRFSTHIGAEL